MYFLVDDKKDLKWYFYFDEYPFKIKEGISIIYKSNLSKN